MSDVTAGELADVICESMQRRRTLLAVLRASGFVSALGTTLFAGLIVYLHREGAVADQSVLDLCAVGLVLSFMTFFVAWWVVGGWHWFRCVQTRRRLAARGVACVAEVVRARQTGGSENDHPELELWLRVDLPGAPPYVAVHCQVVELLFLSRVQPGAQLPVVVDPGRRESMRIDALRWETEI